MDRFESIGEMNNLFVQRKLRELPENIIVAGVPYFLRDSASIIYPIPQMLNKNHKAFVVYSVTHAGKEMEHYQTLRDEGALDEWIILIWQITPGLMIIPARVVATTEARAKPDMQTATGELARHRPFGVQRTPWPRDVAPEPVGEAVEQHVISDQVDVKFKRFDKTIKAKTDTGANMSSLHVDRWTLLPGKNKVEFDSRLLSDNTLTVDCVDQVVVKTSEGTEYRPVIALDIEVDGKEISKAQFNLNDRSHMQDPILIGQNILEKGRFLVDPTKIKDTIPRMESEEEFDIDWDELQTRFKDIKIIEEEIDTEKVEELYHWLLESEVSFSDLLRHIKTIAYKTLEETENY